MSIRETIISNVVTLLNTGAPGGTPTARRGYLMSLDASLLPAMIVYPTEEDAEVQLKNNMPSLTLRTLKIEVAVYAKSSATDPPDKTVEPHLAWVVKALSGKRGTANAGPYILIYEDGTKWEYEQLEHGYVRATVTIGVRYQSKMNDPDTWA